MYLPSKGDLVCVVPGCTLEEITILLAGEGTPTWVYERYLETFSCIMEVESTRHDLATDFSVLVKPDEVDTFNRYAVPHKYLEMLFTT